MKQEMYDLFNRIEEKHWWFCARRAIIQTLLNAFIKKGHRRRILDIGCGTGGMLNMLKQFGSVSALDCDEHALSYAGKKVGSGITLIKGSLPDDLPRDQQFDIIAC